MFKELIIRVVLNIVVGTPLMILFNIEGNLCEKCNSTDTVSAGKPQHFKRCLICGYIWEGIKPKKIKKVKEAVYIENSCAEDYLDYLQDQW